MFRSFVAKIVTKNQKYLCIFVVYGKKEKNDFQKRGVQEKEKSYNIIF